MKTYNLCVDRKYTIWEREYYTIEVESETEALDKVDIHKNNPTLLYYNDLSSK